MTTQSELSIARELAGLPDETLAGLAAVFARSPRRRRTDSLRFSIPLGAVLLVLGAVILGVDASSAGNALSPMRTLGIGCLAAGAIAVIVGVLAAFSMMALDVAHGTLGLHVGLLDEQHPWLYKASHVTRDDTVDAYRRRILGERGPLRGTDYLLMREIARANDAMDMTRVARTVSARLNQLDIAPAEVQGKEPRLVSVVSSSAEMPVRSFDEPTHAASVHTLSSTSPDRRRPA